MADPEIQDQVSEIAINVTIRLSILFLIFYACFFVVAPFLTVLLWSIILAVTVYPVQQWLARKLGGRQGLASTLIVLTGLVIILGPFSMLTAATLDSLHVLEDGLADGSIVMPPPPEGIEAWPFIGQKLASFWWLAATNMSSAIGEIRPQVQAIGGDLLKASAGASVAVLQFTASIIIAGLLFGPGKSLAGVLRTFEQRILSRNADRFVDLANATVQNVARGVIGVALLQTILAGIGYVAADYPFGAAITVVVLILSILNLGPTLPVFASIAYAWTFMDVMPALLFSVYMVPVGLLDNFLRPIIVARGLPVPMAVMFIGVVGGALTGGLLGLFIGPVVLAVGYQLFAAWISDTGSEDGAAATDEAGVA